MKRPAGLPRWVWTPSLPVNCVLLILWLAMTVTPALRSGVGGEDGIPWWLLVLLTVGGVYLVGNLIASIVYLLRHPHLRTDIFAPKPARDDDRPW